MAHELNLPEALARLDGDSALLAELATLFLQETPPLLANLQAAVAERDLPRIESHAHSLKGSVSNFGSSRVHDYAFALEQKARAGDLTDMDDLLTSFEQSLDNFMADLRAVCADG